MVDKEMILQKILELFETLPSNDEPTAEAKPQAAELAIEVEPKAQN